MQKNSSENKADKGPGKAVKYVLMGFVALSVGAVIYKNLPCCSGDAVGNAPAEMAAPAAAALPTPATAAAKPAPESPAAKKPAAKVPQAAKTAVVYYFYTSARCYSCKMIEEYTRAAVEKHFAQPYNGWRVEFKGVNLDEEPNRHFVQDYWLNSKSVVVQKFEGGKPLNWGMLKSVWQLLGDKEKYMAYVSAETRKVLDSK